MAPPSTPPASFDAALEASRHSAALTSLRRAIAAGRGRPESVARILGLTRRRLYLELGRAGITGELEAARARALLGERCGGVTKSATGATAGVALVTGCVTVGGGRRSDYRGSDGGHGPGDGGVGGAVGGSMNENDNATEGHHTTCTTCGAVHDSGIDETVTACPDCNGVAPVADELVAIDDAHLVKAAARE